MLETYTRHDEKHEENPTIEEILCISCEDMQQQTAPRRTVILGVLRLSLVCRRESYEVHAIIVGIYLTKLRKTETRKTRVDREIGRDDQEKMQERLKPLEDRERASKDQEI